MGDMSFFDSKIRQMLMDLHCAYIGKIAWTDGNTATVQPLGLIKEHGKETTKTQAVVQDVPVACKYKVSTDMIEYVDKDGEAKRQTIAVPRMIAKGDLVVCVCCDRNIADARRGDNVLPPAGNHSISDSVVVGIL